MSFWIEPDWPAPQPVRAVSTLRCGGISSGPYASLNLGHHVGDDAECVLENRRRLSRELSLPAEPLWLQQVHGSRIIDADGGEEPIADGSVAAQPGTVCAVMTADCLPILLCTEDGERVAAVHGGWRGLAAGVLEAAADRIGTSALLAWLGPAIGADAFEVGAEVRQTFLQQSEVYSGAFRPCAEDRWLADIYEIARIRLAALGVTRCYGGECCTYTDGERFFSYRRDGITGRMATLIWRE